MSNKYDIYNTSFNLGGNINVNNPYEIPTDALGTNTNIFEKVAQNWRNTKPRKTTKPTKNR